MPESDGHLAATRAAALRAASASNDGFYLQLAQGEAHHASKETARMRWTIGPIYVALPEAGAAECDIRQQNGRDELLVPVRFDRGEAKVAYSIVW